MDLGRNKITGPIPPEWSGLSSMVSLVLNHNRLDGTLPDFLWHDWPALARLDLSHNKLYGPVHADVGRLRVLEVLKLNHNRLSESLPSFKRCNRLQYVGTSEGAKERPPPPNAPAPARPPPIPPAPARPPSFHPLPLPRFAPHARPPIEDSPSVVLVAHAQPTSPSLPGTSGSTRTASTVRYPKPSPMPIPS